jgi:hypothetical protein
VRSAADDVSLQAVAVLVADAKTPEAKSDAATRVQEKIDNAEASISVASTEAADQAKEVLKQAKAALASDNLAQAMAKVQESADLTNVTTTVEDPSANVNANTNAPITNVNVPATNTPAQGGSASGGNTGKIKAIDF